MKPKSGSSQTTKTDADGEAQQLASKTQLGLTYDKLMAANETYWSLSHHSHFVVAMVVLQHGKANLKLLDQEHIVVSEGTQRLVAGHCSFWHSNGCFHFKLRQKIRDSVPSRILARSERMY